MPNPLLVPKFNPTAAQRAAAAQAGSTIPGLNGLLADWLDFIVAEIDWDTHTTPVEALEKLTRAHAMINQFAFLFLSGNEQVELAASLSPDSQPAKLAQPAKMPVVRQVDDSADVNPDCEAQRPLLVCAGCGGEKDEGAIVCWHCFKGDHALAFKYWQGPWREWLIAMKLIRDAKAKRATP